MTQPAADPGHLDWLVEDFARTTPGVAHALVVSSDGLALVLSDRLDPARADQLAAIACGVASLADGADRLLESGGVRQTVVEMAAGFLLVLHVQDGSYLAVLASAACDMGVVGYQATVLARQAGEQLTPALRTELQAARPG